MILLAWLILLSIFIGIPSTYYLYLHRVARRPWNLKIDEAYRPPVSIIIPAHNEERTIRFKLENLRKAIYSREKMQIILVDDASIDNTVNEVLKFIKGHPELNIEMINVNVHKGKSRALNIALNHAKNDTVILSDADTFWAPDIMIKALPYLADSSVGAVIGQERLLNSEQSWVTQSERTYINLVNETVRVGESKIHSNIFFHGLFAVFKREYLKEFNLEIDDSGTALDIVQKGARTLSIPEAACFDMFPTTWRGKISVKIRRASQLVQICFRCLKLSVKRQLLLSKKIAIPEIFLYLFNPVIFLVLIMLTPVLFLEFLPLSLVLLLLLLPVFVMSKARLIFIETLQNNFILIIALLMFLSKKQFIVWETQKEPRSLLTKNTLEKENLI